MQSESISPSTTIPTKRRGTPMSDLTSGDLTRRHCTACAPGTPALPEAQVEEYLRELPGWERRGNEISKALKFQNYYETIAFVNAIAWISHREDHHPDLEVGYNRLRIRYSTHSVGGLSENDFICAAKAE